MSFDAEYQPLSPEHPQWGTVAVLPWDADTFGFPVADFRPGTADVLARERQAIHEHLAAWAGELGVELVSCRVAGDDTAAAAALQGIGFYHVETSLCVTRLARHAAPLPAARVHVRAPETADREPLLGIAERAFRHGRYHADGRFRRQLADRRYRRWLENTLDRPTPGTRVYVLGPAGRPLGFLHAELNGTAADLRLGGVDPESNPGFAGYQLYLSVLHALAAEGAARVVAQVSATNAAVLNVYAALGFRFSTPELVFHWHRSE